MQYSPTWANRLSGRGDTWLTADRRSGRRPSAKWVLRFSILLGVFCISTAILAVEGQAALQENDLQGARQHISSRRLLSANDTSNVPVYERCDFETDNYPYAFVVLYAVCVLIFFIALAIICDDFFVPSLEVISEKLDLSEDVAGATFMAAGSSAPELFTSIAGVSVDSDVGVGTIVGSAVFNINIIIALTAALAGQVLNLDYRPLIRDSVFYALSIACFIGFSWDGKFKIEEAIIMLLLYGFYIGIMKFNSSIMNSRCCKSRVGPVPLDEEGSIEGENEDTHMKRSSSTLESFSNVGPPGKLPSIQDDAHPQKEESLSVTGDHKHVFHHVKHGELSSHFLENDHHHLHHSHANEHGVWYLFVVKGHPTKSTEKRHSVAGDDHVRESAANGNIKEDAEDLTEEEDEPTLRPIPCLPAINMYYPEKDILQEKCGYFRLILKWFLFLVSFPFVCLFTWTIPNCGNPKYRKWYIASFTISVIWIAALSFAMVTLVIRAGCILHVDHYTMGLVIVAIGTSVPDALSSILVARDGYGDMAVSNALGSNVFDINLGLGLPYVIKIAIMGGKPFQLISDAEMVMLNSGDMVITPHAKFGFILLLILVLTLIIFAAVRFRLNKVVGVSFVAMYVLFLIYAFVQEIVCDYNC